MITQTYYISTGALNAMYTLRVSQTEVGGIYSRDSYICNLAATPELAKTKAIAYFELMQERFPETADFKMELDADSDIETNKRRGTLSISDTRNIELIEAGIFPFGKHKGTKIIDAPDSYIMYFAVMNRASMETVAIALSCVCMGIALEKGLIAKRDAAIADRLDRDLQSSYVSKVGKRLMFTGVLEFSIRKFNDYNEEYFINKFYCGLDVIMYIGKKAGVVGESITFKATVKDHSEYNGCKSTKVNRPVFA